MTITPLAPLDPYIAVEAASFSISIDAISLGFRKLKGFDGSTRTAPIPKELASPPEGNGYPSNTIKGSLFPLTESGWSIPNSLGGKDV